MKTNATMKAIGTPKPVSHWSLAISHSLPLLLAACLALFATTAQAQVTTGTTGDGLVYAVNSGTAITITAYSGTGGDVGIPATINVSGTDLPVTSIGDWAFCGCTSLTSVTIPGSVTSIGNYAFVWCTGLERAVFRGNAPEMGYEVFGETASGFTVY